MKHLQVAADIIQTAGLGTIGADLFINSIPSDITFGVMLKDWLTGAPVDDAMGTFTDHQFQVIVRGLDPPTAWQRAYDIGQALRVDRLTLQDIFILKMNPLTVPVTYPREFIDDELETSIRIHVAFALL